jgi:hypothetical protein
MRYRQPCKECSGVGQGEPFEAPRRLVGVVAAVSLWLVAACATVPSDSSKASAREPALEVPERLYLGGYQFTAGWGRMWSTRRRPPAGAVSRGQVQHVGAEPVTITDIEVEYRGGYRVDLWRAGEPVGLPVTLQRGEVLDVTAIRTVASGPLANTEVIIHTDESESIGYRIVVGVWAQPTAETFEVAPSPVVDFGEVGVGETRTKTVVLSGSRDLPRVARGDLDLTFAGGIFRLNAPPRAAGEDPGWIWLVWEDRHSWQPSMQVGKRQVEVEVSFTPPAEGEFVENHVVVAMSNARLVRDHKCWRRQRKLLENRGGRHDFSEECPPIYFSTDLRPVGLPFEFRGRGVAPSE